jgi:hypothetical protein
MDQFLSDLQVCLENSDHYLYLLHGRIRIIICASLIKFTKVQLNFSRYRRFKSFTNILGYVPFHTQRLHVKTSLKHIIQSQFPHQMIIVIVIIFYSMQVNN